MLSIKVYCCPYQDCEKNYQGKFNLKKHVIVRHLKIKTFNCNECGKKFVSKQNLREHKFIHLGIKPFRCSFCGKKFRQTSQLCMHKRKHKKLYAETLEYVVELDK